MSTLLSLRNLTRRYGGNIAVNDVGFDVAEGEILGIMGANGAGKTTLFAMIAGNVVPSSGQILLDGQAVQGLPPERINALGVSRTFQIVRPFPSMTVLENATVAAMYGRRQTKSPALAREQAMAVLEETGLADRAHLPASQLNLAGRKRLEIARALATGPRVLLLDEVLAGLNATEVEAALDLIRAVRERHKLSIVIIEHVMKALMRLSDRIVVLHEGRKVVEGLPAEVANDPRVIKAYLGEQRHAHPA
ncbi:ABC transporter ATP-binding protein [Aquabacterium soli]|uniref:ABC transporter ATP-binding protein n=1 Tax=Aquabacterium soli TaxID=2493092 RepID=A0A426VAX7_9BURK|nr:ABC transporter ATP-binding protein [Aquabacterium soli]RRS03858.1 ABC transporter ATP-binding protein [Aquabacterium soli]